MYEEGAARVRVLAAALGAEAIAGGEVLRRSDRRDYISLSRARAHGLLIRPTRSFSPPLMSDSARLSLCLLPASPVLTFEF